MSTLHKQLLEAAKRVNAAEEELKISEADFDRLVAKSQQASEQASVPMGKGVNRPPEASRGKLIIPDNPSTLKGKILKCMRDQTKDRPDKVFNVKMLSRLIRSTKRQASGAATGLVKEGYIERVDIGIYRMPQEGDA